MNTDKRIDASDPASSHFITRFVADVNGTSRLGIDIGRVIMCPTHDDGRPDTSFLGASDAAALEVPAAPDMFEVVPRLVQRFGGRVWLVSKAGQRIEGLTRRWLERHRFFERTAIDPGQVRFCRRREEKRLHSDDLRLTHFIDDRLDVLSYLRAGVPHLALFGVQTGPIPDWVVHVPSWSAFGGPMSEAEAGRLVRTEAV